MYKVALVGLGKRGMIHARSFVANADYYQLAAICDINEERLSDASKELDGAEMYTDVERMLSEVKPDVFCFATLPNVRLSMVELAVKYGVRAIALEKPMAVSLEEATQMSKLCRENGIKAIVSHQQKYLTSMQELKRIVDSGEIGEIMFVTGNARLWSSQLATHLIDYMMWAVGGSKVSSVTGHIHGSGKLSDTHPSPDFLQGELWMENGVRGSISCGYLNPEFDGLPNWASTRLTVYGTHGYALAETDGRWQAFTKFSNGETIGGQGVPWQEQQHFIQTPYLYELAQWLDDDSKVHSRNIEMAYHGYQVMEGIIISALDNIRVDFPLSDIQIGENTVKRMESRLTETPNIIW